VPLQHERGHRRREGNVDEAGLKSRQHVGHGQHGRRQAKRLHGHETDGIALGHPHFFAAHVLDATNRLVGEQIREAALDEPKRHEPGTLETGLELGIEYGTHGIDLVERTEQQRNAVEIQRTVTLAEPAGREGPALQLTDANLAQDLRVVAHDAAGIELDRYAAVGSTGHLFGAGAHLLHPARAVGGDGGDLDVDGLRRQARHRQ
jgi:hypothetical protein